MIQQNVTGMIKAIAIALSDMEWSEHVEKKQQVVDNHLNQTYFRDHIADMALEQDYSCTSVFQLCERMIRDLSGKMKQQDLLNSFYQEALSRAFPQTPASDSHAGELTDTRRLYLEVLRVFSRLQQVSEDGTWQSRYPLVFLTRDEEKALENPIEYRRFVKAFQHDYIYEMMKLNQELLGFNTLDHICGVHHLAMHIGRQLKQAGLPVDLGRVSGAAAGHDIGKYGCKPNEYRKVPYLHYYYTDQWFKRHDIPYIGHIALNHSTWDLELENLPLESLILIYSDFRVKNRIDNAGKEKMHIFDLRASFKVILDKLDNVDQEKERRYQRVYAKLKDFEAYIVSLGITVSPDDVKPDALSIPVRHTPFALLQGSEIIQRMKYMAINHNINLMHRLRDEYSLTSILELARSENDWKKLREYIHVFEEYSTYLTQKQKLIMIRFLFEQLVHSEDDIRRQCAELIGLLIATFDEDYRKEVPENVFMAPPPVTSSDLLDKYMHMFVFPDHKMVPLHRNFIGYSISSMIAALFNRCRAKQIEEFKQVIIKYYLNSGPRAPETDLYLLEATRHIPLTGSLTACNAVYDFILQLLSDARSYIRISALEMAYSIMLKLRQSDSSLSCREAYDRFVSGLKSHLEKSTEPSDLPAENYLMLRLSGMSGVSDNISRALSKACSRDDRKISETFLSNLKSATGWVVKRTQVDYLLSYALEEPGANGFYTAMHFCNLLKVSAVENVRNRAGEALIRIIPHLSPEQRNDVAVELLRALEISGYQYAEYIPLYFGKLILFLQPVELDEIIDDFIIKLKHSSPQLNSLILRTVGIAVVHYVGLKDRLHEDHSLYINRMTKMLGILLNGVAHFDLQVKQAAFSALGREIFGSAALDLEEKQHIFRLVAKKILNLMTDSKDVELLFLTNSAGLNHIYRFIADYTFFRNDIQIRIPEKVAFFPGAFDPFSLSHKEISKAIRNLGFEVYLSVDEFSWSKRTLPNLLRKNIINMSAADELDIYLYPENYPVNIANPKDLECLRSSFPHSEVFIVAGSDVIVNASAYKQQKTPHSILSFSHILFERRILTGQGSLLDAAVDDSIRKIEGEVIRLTLPSQLEDISSTQIRDYIDENRDITMMVDPLVQQYIYENGFYQREPQYKSLIKTMSIDIEVIEEINRSYMEEIAEAMQISLEAALDKFNVFFDKPSYRLLLIRNANQKGRIIGFTAFHRIHFSLLYQEFKNSAVTEYIRNHSAGKIVHIDGVFVCTGTVMDNFEQILLTETLSYCLTKDYDYAVFNNVLNAGTSYSLLEALELKGFTALPLEGEPGNIMTVNMSKPCTLNLDIETMIKEPYRSNTRIVKAIAKTRKRLLRVMTGLYPGYLTLPFDRNIMYEVLVKKICMVNQVPAETLVPRVLGPSMCVPYGTVLGKSIVPNTVTKALHTEKMFEPDAKAFSIGPFPYYLDLESQIRMLRSFDRPVILVDDILDKGHRIRALDPLFKKENIKIEKIIVGILSGSGKELMEIQGHEVDSAYFIPKLRDWFNENAFYPFIGGDALWRGEYPSRNLLPSLNLILPYASPAFLKGVEKKSIFKLSETAIENAIEILSIVEEEFQEINERSMTLASMGQVFTTPRCPDHGKHMEYDLSRCPSFYLKNDLELLNRLENVLR